MEHVKFKSTIKIYIDRSLLLQEQVRLVLIVKEVLYQRWDDRIVDMLIQPAYKKAIELQALNLIGCLQIIKWYQLLENSVLKQFVKSNMVVEKGEKSTEGRCRKNIDSANLLEV